MEVILSIKPKYAKRIFNGTKKYEFRKRIFKKPNVDTIIVYATSPVKKLVGYFLIDDIIKTSPEKLWEMSKEKAGIAKQEFFSYFNEREVGFGIKIKRAVQFNPNIPPREIIPDFYPPQSFSYCNVLETQMITSYM
jgi:predicted transcriptional regulator